MRSVTDAFTGTPTHSSTLGGKANCQITPYPPVSAAGLAAGSYKWRERETTISDGPDAWAEFAGSGTAFVIAAPDSDGDGVSPPADCTDANPAIRPGAIELPGDGTDQNCDGQELCFVNADGDGFRTAATVPSADADCADAGEALAALATGDCDAKTAPTRPCCARHSKRCAANGS